MKRILLLGLVLCLFSPMAVFGQTLCPSSSSAKSEDSDSASALSNLPLVKALKAEKLLINPYVQVGYQHLGTNMSLPTSAVPRGPNQLFIGTLDVTLKDFNFWTGTAGLNIIAAPVTLFGSIGGYAPSLFRMSGVVPITDNTGTIVPDITFTGSHFEFWTAQVGAGIDVCKGFSILGGYVWSHTAAEFTDPRIGAVPLPNQTLRGDVSMNVGAPFLGIQFLEQGYYRGAVLYSPLARSWGALSLQTSTPDTADLRYSLNQPGTFFAVNAEYWFLFKPPVMLSAWILGTYAHIRGTSDLEFTTPGPAISRDVTITNTQYGLAGGVTFGLVF